MRVRGRGRCALVAMGVLSLLCVGSQVGISAIDLAPSAKADGSGGNGRTGLLAKRYLVAKRGGTVRARNGAELRVPARVMRRDGFASIRRLSPQKFDIHIAAPWRGAVTVLLPVRRRSAPRVLPRGLKIDRKNR